MKSGRPSQAARTEAASEGEANEATARPKEGRGSQEMRVAWLALAMRRTRSCTAERSAPCRFVKMRVEDVLMAAVQEDVKEEGW